jgi:hypothetical protein
MFTKKLYLDCYTVYEHIAEFYPITWHNQQLHLHLWTDVSVEIHRDKGGQIRSDYATADRVSALQPHDPQQWQGYIDSQQYQHYKILAPWHIEASEPVKFVMSPHPDMLAHMGAVTVPPGDIDFVYQRAIHVNTFWHTDAQGDASHLLTAGTGLVSLTPIEPRHIIVRTHCVTLDEFNRKNYTPKFLGLYRERYARDQERKGCPFA